MQLPEFAGPLDLLLQLIEKNELEITKLALAQVADQYLAYLREGERKPDVGEMAAFLVVAAKLLYLKSQQLLPKPPLKPVEEKDEAEEVGEELVRRLQEYRQIKSAAEELKRREQRGEHSYLRRQPPPDVRPHFDDYGLSGVTLAQLSALARRRTQLLLSLDANSKPRPPSPLQPWRVSVSARLKELRARLGQTHRYTFNELLAAHPAPTRIGRAHETVLTFMAVLEMMRRRVARVEQDQPFGEIVISERPAD